jgi:hypothetical protein
VTDAPPVVVDSAIVVDGPGPHDVSHPRFASAGMYSATVPSTTDPIDIYYPNPGDLTTGNYHFPVIVMIQGANVDKANYAMFASLVARYGFIVAVPNHSRTVVVVSGLYAEPTSVIAAFSFIGSENGRQGAPIAQVADLTKLGVLGHSFGSVVGLDLIAQTCTSPACPGSFSSPSALRAGVFYGASLRPLFGGPISPTDNRGLGTMLVQGTVDGLNKPVDAKDTYDSLTKTPRAYVTVTGANHYGIADSNAPQGAMADSSTQTMPQATSIETIGRWTAVFLLATIDSDPDAHSYVVTGNADPNVTVTSAL